MDVASGHISGDGIGHRFGEVWKMLQLAVEATAHSPSLPSSTIASLALFNPRSSRMPCGARFGGLHELRPLKLMQTSIVAAARRQSFTTIGQGRCGDDTALLSCGNVRS